MNIGGVDIGPDLGGPTAAVLDLGTPTAFGSALGGAMVADAASKLAVPALAGAAGALGGYLSARRMRWKQSSALATAAVLGVAAAAVANK